MSFSPFPSDTNNTTTATTPDTVERSHPAVSAQHSTALQGPDRRRRRRNEDGRFNLATVGLRKQETAKHFQSDTDWFVARGPADPPLYFYFYFYFYVDIFRWVTGSVLRYCVCVPVAHPHTRRGRVAYFVLRVVEGIVVRCGRGMIWHPTQVCRTEKERVDKYATSDGSS